MPAGTRAERRSPAVVWGALGAYVVMIIAVALTHEMWRDEVRAFSVATGSASWSQLVSELRFEGHPILWYALLRAGFLVTGSKLVLPGLALAIAAAAAFVILRYAPFPTWLRILAVFGAFLGYELSVNARNYGLSVLLILIACVAFEHRKNRPLPLGIVLFLLANTSVHGAMAAMVLLLVWGLDLLDAERRKRSISVAVVGALAIAVGGIAVALATARPVPELAWAAGLESLSLRKILAAIFVDPGLGLRGVRDANIAAVSEYPWHLLGMEGAWPSRIMVDVSLAWLAWCLRRNLRALLAVAVTVVGYSIFFRNIYGAGLRHEGIVLFVIFAICWIDQARAPNRAISLGLLPLFALQALALPVLIHRTQKYRESNSKAFAEFIRANPRYESAVLMSEPDYMMESMPYYVGNPVFMPRQAEFASRVFFDRTGRRKADMTLADLLSAADRVSCDRRQPVLLAIGYPEIASHPQGKEYPLYRGLTFTWDAESKARLGPPVARFPEATTDELYAVYEVGCATSATRGM
ncbi:MAG TPA: hypothetical protein VGC52_14340 [Gemmatimonadaceae bacterium]